MMHSKQTQVRKIWTKQHGHINANISKTVKATDFKSSRSVPPCGLCGLGRTLICIVCIHLVEMTNKRLKVDIYIPPLHEHDQQRLTMRSGVLTGNDTRWRSTSSGSPLPERTDFGPRSLQPDSPTYAPASRTMAFTPQCAPYCS